MEEIDYDKTTLYEVTILQSVSAALQLTSLGFNGAIIYTIWRKSLMRVPSSRFVFSLCLSHLLVSIISLGVSAISYFIPSQAFLQNVPLLEAGNDNENGYSCVDIGPAILNHTLLYMTFGVSISTLLTVTLISVERYITIARPMKYKSIVTPRRCFTAISLCWILAAIFVIFPVVFYHKKTKQCGAFLVPIGNVGLYFALVISLLTILALTVMIVCYSHIFTIAKSKCQKVQIGQFSSISAPASISSDWPSSVYSGVQGHQGQQSNRGWFHPGSRMTSSNSLLHWVLMANLRQHSNPLRSAHGLKSPDLSPTSSIKSEPDSIQRSPGSSTSKDTRGLSRAKRKWRKYLQQNYNSPKKTVCTILCLIGSVIITQVPMSFILFTHLESNPVLFYFCHDLLFAISSVTNPILYGFLNRNIRDQLWKIFRPKTRRRNRQKRANSLSNNCTGLRGEFHDILTPRTEKLVMSGSVSRKGSLTSEDSNSTNGCVAVSRMPSTSSSGFGEGSGNPNPSVMRRKDTAIIGLDELDRFKLRRKPTVGLGLGGFASKKFIEFKEFNPIGPKCSGESEKKKVNERIPEEEVEVVRHDVREVEQVQMNGADGEEPLGLVDDEDEEALQQLEFPRKPSQDSGADMSFSDEDQDDGPDEEVVPVNARRSSIAKFMQLPSQNSSNLYPQPLCRSCFLLGSRKNFNDRAEITAAYLGVTLNPNLDMDGIKSKSKSDSDISGVRRNSQLVDPQLLQQHQVMCPNEEAGLTKSQCHLGSSSGQEMTADFTISSTSSQLPLILNSVSSSRRQSCNLNLPEVHEHQETCTNRNSSSSSCSGHDDLNNLDVTNDATNGGLLSFCSSNLTPSCSKCTNYSQDNLLHSSSSCSGTQMFSDLPKNLASRDEDVQDVGEDCDNEDSMVVVISKDLIRVGSSGGGVVSGKSPLPHNDSFCSISSNSTNSDSGSSSSTTGSDEDDDEDEEEEEFQEVMEKVLSYLAFPEWKTCRTVCSFWNEVVLKSKLNRSSVVHLEDISLLTFLSILEMRSQMCSSLSTPAFENYNLNINSTLSQNEKMELLWEKTGSRIRKLRIEMTTLYALKKLRDILLSKTDSLEEIRIIVTEYWGNKKLIYSNHLNVEESQLPQPNYNLRKFCYSYLGSLSLYGMGNQDDFSFPLDWVLLFQRFPCLQKFSLVGLSELELTQMLTALQSVKAKENCHNQGKSSRHLDFTELELLDENMCPEAPNNAHMQILIDLKLPLTHLHLEVSPILSVALLNNLLSQLSPSLEVLRLRRFPLIFLSDERITLRISMPHVTLLEISNELVTSLEFLPFFPKLETLQIILRDYRNLPSCEMIANTPTSQVPHQTLKNVFIEPPLASEDCILSLGRLVPHLKRLKIRLDDEMLWALCGSQTISQVLEDLHIIAYGGLTDEGFTGISEDGWNHLVQGGLMNNHNHEEVHQFRIYPFIGDLVKLRRLTVEMWSDYTNHVSDNAVHFGIVELNKLTEFHAIRLQLSPNTIRLISDRLEVCKIDD